MPDKYDVCERCGHWLLEHSGETMCFGFNGNLPMGECYCPGFKLKDGGSDADD